MAEMEPAAAKLAEQIVQLRADIAKVADTLSALGQTGRATFAATLAEKAGDVKSVTEAKLGQSGEAAEASLAELTDYARRNPLQAMALAGGAGLLLGYLCGRR